MSDLPSLATTLRERANALPNHTIVAGFDGFVDEMIRVVADRSGVDHWQGMAGIADFGRWVDGAVGKSSLREIVVERVDPGGCTVNLADGLAHLGLAVDVFATLGNPVHPAFAAPAAHWRSVRSWGREPGRTLALQFDDGKLMLSSTSQLAEFDPALLDDVLADGLYLEACRKADLVALTNWTLYPHMTACWRRLQKRVYSQLEERPVFFLDLVDPRSRSDADVCEMLAVLADFQANGECYFGGNLNETNTVSRLLGVAEVEAEGPSVADQAAALRERLGLTGVVTHCVRGAAMADANGATWVDGPWCAKPVRTVGAGDRFNAGWCAGAVLGLPAAQRLALGNAASGFFVRRARSGSARELADFVDAWAGQSLAD